MTNKTNLIEKGLREKFSFLSSDKCETEKENLYYKMFFFRQDNNRKYENMIYIFFLIRQIRQNQKT